MSSKLSTVNCDNTNHIHHVGQSTLILAVLYLPHSLLYVSFSSVYRTVCYFEEVSLGMKVLSEETDLGDVFMLKKSDRTILYLEERIYSMCLGKIPIHYVFRELLYKNIFSLITAVTLFMTFFA